MVQRIRLSDITFERVNKALIRRLDSMPHVLSWYSPGSLAKRNREKLNKLRDLHRGDRCILMANGPSLNLINFDQIRNEITIGMNRIYLLFDKLPSPPTYYICVNEFVLEEFASDIGSLEMTKFLNWNRRALFSSDDEHTIFLRLSLTINDYFGLNPIKGFASGGTVTFNALQLAYFMGFKQVIIIGLDHSYSEKGVPNKIEVRTNEKDTSHFHPDYFPKGVKWQLPDLLRSEIAYAMARKQFEHDGREILDATIGGQCPNFKKVTLESVL